MHRPISRLAIAMALLGANASSLFPAYARSVDVVPVVDLNFRYADCQPQLRTYDLQRYSTMYYGASIVCQLNVAYITYDRKWKYQAG
jgi:hypothetical protein